MIERRSTIAARRALTKRGTPAISRVRQTPLGRDSERADRLFSEHIRRRDGACRRCGATINLECAHIFTRRRLSTAWADENAVALCHACHVMFTSHPNQWTEWVVSRFGEDYYDALRRKSLEIATDVRGIVDLVLRDGYITLGLTVWKKVE